MGLVSPSQSSPGEEITASKINDPINQIAAVVNGGLDDSNISSVSGSRLVNGSVTPAKLSDEARGGLHMRVVTFTAGTGTKPITGFGFKPKMVRFDLAMTSSNTSYSGFGVAVDGSPISQYTYASASSPAGSRSSRVGDTSLLGVSVSATEFQGAVTSFNDDGVTVNISSDNSSFRTWVVTAWA